MAAAAASASQDELSKCRGELAPASRSWRYAGLGAARREGWGALPAPRGAPTRVGGRRPRREGAGALGPGGRAGRRTPPPAFVGLRFAPSRCEIETGAPGGATSARDPPGSEVGGAQPPARGAWARSPARTPARRAVSPRPV